MAMSYAVHYDLSTRGQDGLLQDFSRMRIETAREPPVLYVAMATWIPKCNMYHNCESKSPTPERNQVEDLEPIEETIGQKLDSISEEVPEDSKVKNETVMDVEEEEEEVSPETKSLDSVNETAESKVSESLDTNEETKQKIDETDQETPNISINSEPEKSQIEPKATKQIEDKLTITPKKAMSPKQLAKKLESEKKRQQKQLEREEREKKKQEERERSRLEKQKQKQEKEEQKLKEKQQKEEQKQKERELKEEQKRKEREEKEAKRKEKEEREEQKRKEREQEKLRKQQELEEKNKEKQKLEEQKQKTAAAFVSFFVKKTETKVEDEVKTSVFMPFQIKSDMRLAPARRPVLTEDEKDKLVTLLSAQDENASYLKDLKAGKRIGKSPKTWPYEDDDVLIVEEDFGESICEEEDKLKPKKMRAKFLKFHENRRPPYFGTWRKKSNVIKPQNPLKEDKIHFDYEVDSDDDWEEEEQGESLSSDDEDNKENEGENDDYEVDNEFFVPHGHLSEDEVDDEATAKLSPESQKQKLKLLKDEFDQDMQTKTHKMKPRSIGCIWYNKNGSNVDETIDRHLRPLAMITNGQIIIKKRKEVMSSQTPTRKYGKALRKELIPAFLKLIHGNMNKRTMVVDDFINWMQNNGYVVEVSKAYLGKKVKEFAQWKKCPEEGSMLNKFCWCVEDDVKKKYNVDLCLK